MKNAKGRIMCVVPYCGRTMKDDGASEESICGPHWRMTDSHLRRRWSKLKRLSRRAITGDVLMQLDRMREKAWARLSEQAIERAMGISA